MAHWNEAGRVRRVEGFGARVGCSTGERAFNPVELPILLLFVQPPKGHRINADPRSILPDSSGADRFAVFLRKRRVGFDCNQDGLFDCIGQRCFTPS